MPEEELSSVLAWCKQEIVVQELTLHLLVRLRQALSTQHQYNYEFLNQKPGRRKCDSILKPHHHKATKLQSLASLRSGVSQKHAYTWKEVWRRILCKVILWQTACTSIELFLQLAGVPFSKVMQQGRPAKRQKTQPLGFLGPATPAEQAHSMTPNHDDGQTALGNGSTNGELDSRAEWHTSQDETQSKLVIDRLSGLAMLDSEEQGIFYVDLTLWKRLSRYKAMPCEWERSVILTPSMIKTAGRFFSFALGLFSLPCSVQMLYLICQDLKTLPAVFRTDVL